MNALRRILLVFYSLLVLGAVGGLASLAWDQDEKLDLKIDALNIQAFVQASDNAKYALTGVLALIGLVAVLTILVALWPHGEGRKGSLRIKQSDGGTVEVTSSAVEALLRDELEALPEVQRAKPRVRLAGGAVDTFVDASIEPSASIAHATKLVSSTVESTLREHVGVTSIRRPVIRISYDEAAARPIPGGRMRKPATEPPPHSSYQPAVYPDDPARGEGFKPQQTLVAEPLPEPARPTTADTPAEIAPARDILNEVPNPARPPEAPRFVSSADEDPPHDDRT